MRRRMLLPDTAEVALECLQATGPDTVVMVLRGERNKVSCPRCGVASRRVHSRYLRKLADLPWEGVAVTIRLRARSFSV